MKKNRIKNAVAGMVLLCCTLFVWDAFPASGKNGGETKSLVNGQYFFALDYDPQDVVAVCMSSPPAPNHGAAFLLHDGGHLYVDASYEMEKTDYPNFLYKMKDCTPVDCGGAFRRYYVCQDSIMAMVPHPVGNYDSVALYSIYYDFSKGSLNQKALDVILQSFRFLTTSLDSQKEEWSIETVYAGMSLIEDSSLPGGIRVEHPSPCTEFWQK